MKEVENQETQETIDDILKRIQILKIENELKEIKKNYFKKFIYPELPKWIPVLFLGFVTLWIATSKDIIGAKEDKLVANEKAFEVKKIEENIKKLKEEQISKKDSVKSLDVEFINKLSEIKDLNNKIASYQKLYDNERNKANKLGQIQFELTYKNIELTKESSKIKVSSMLDGVYNNPNINNKYVLEAIEIIKSKSELSELISKEIEENINKSFHKPINYYILYVSTKKEKYLSSIMDGIKKMCYSTKGTFDNNTINELLNMLESRDFSKEEHSLISRTILESVSLNADVKGNLIQFVTLPGYYLEAIYNFDTSFIDETFWISYIALNNRLVKRKNEYDQLRYETTGFQSNQYNYDNLITDKRNLLYNLYKSFPQVAFCHFIEMFSKGNWNSISSIQSESFALGQYLMNISANEFSKCRSLFKSIRDINVFKDTNESTDIKKLLEQLNDLMLELNKYKLKNKDAIGKWIDVDMVYFMMNKEDFKNKLKNCDL